MTACATVSGWRAASSQVMDPPLCPTTSAGASPAGDAGFPRRNGDRRGGRTGAQVDDEHERDRVLDNGTVFLSRELAVLASYVPAQGGSLTSASR